MWNLEALFAINISLNFYRSSSFILLRSSLGYLRDSKNFEHSLGIKISILSFFISLRKCIRNGVICSGRTNSLGLLGFIK